MIERYQSYIFIGVWKNAPVKISQWKYAPQESYPRKIVLLDFCCFLHYFTVVPFKTFYSN